MEPVNMKRKVDTPVVLNMKRKVETPDEPVVLNKKRKMEKPEPLLQDMGPDEAYVFRIKFKQIFEKYKAARACFWVESEIDYSADIVDWDTKLTDPQRRYLKYAIAFFAAADQVVNRNLDMNFADEVTPVEAKMFYHFQMAIEDVHMITYADILRTFIRNEQEINKLTYAVQNFPCIANKAKWAERYMDASKYSFAMRVIAFACMEGIFFSSAFLGIFYFKYRGLLPALTHANSLISRDENLHCEFACHLFMMCVNRPLQDEVYDLVREAVAIESEFVREAIPVSMIGLSADTMCTYVQYCADRLLKDAGYDPLWNSVNPFPWLESISLPQKTNRFEARSAEYQMREDAMVVMDKAALDAVDF